MKNKENGNDVFLFIEIEFLHFCICAYWTRTFFSVPVVLLFWLIWIIIIILYLSKKHYSCDWLFMCFTIMFQSFIHSLNPWHEVCIICMRVSGGGGEERSWNRSITPRSGTSFTTCSLWNRWAETYYGRRGFSRR